MIFHDREMKHIRNLHLLNTNGARKAIKSILKSKTDAFKRSLIKDLTEGYFSLSEDVKEVIDFSNFVGIKVNPFIYKLRASCQSESKE